MSVGATIYHPKCGRRFPSSKRTGHCGQCCETFFGLEAFDKHQQRTDGRPYCYHPATDPRERRNWWIDDLGRWHEGERMSEETRERLKGSA